MSHFLTQILTRTNDRCGTAKNFCEIVWIYLTTVTWNLVKYDWMSSWKIINQDWKTSQLIDLETGSSCRIFLCTWQTNWSKTERNTFNTEILRQFPKIDLRSWIFEFHIIPSTFPKTFHSDICSSFLPADNN